MENQISWALAIQVLSALGTLAALGGLFRIRADNKKVRTEAQDLEDQISERLWGRMERLNASLEKRVQALEQRCTDQDVQLAEQAGIIETLREREKELAARNALLVQVLKNWQAGIDKLLKQIIDNGDEPAWVPIEEIP